MRDYTTKAKRVDNGEWITGYYVYVDYLDKHYILASCKQPLGVNSFLAMKEYEVDPTTICGPTGLTDKNGNKIWENDIVRYYGEGDFKPCSVVKYGEYENSGNMDCYLGFYMGWFSEKLCLRKDIGFWAKEREIKVIGNVFDNPELLGAAENIGYADNGGLMPAT